MGARGRTSRRDSVIQVNEKQIKCPVLWGEMVGNERAKNDDRGLIRPKLHRDRRREHFVLALIVERKKLGFEAHERVGAFVVRAEAELFFYALEALLKKSGVRRVDVKRPQIDRDLEGVEDLGHRVSWDLGCARERNFVRRVIVRFDFAYVVGRSRIKEAVVIGGKLFGLENLVGRAEADLGVRVAQGLRDQNARVFADARIRPAAS